MASRSQLGTSISSVHVDQFTRIAEILGGFEFGASLMLREKKLKSSVEGILKVLSINIELLGVRTESCILTYQ